MVYICSTDRTTLHHATRDGMGIEPPRAGRETIGIEQLNPSLRQPDPVPRFRSLGASARARTEKRSSQHSRDTHAFFSLREIETGHTCLMCGTFDFNGVPVYVMCLPYRESVNSCPRERTRQYDTEPRARSRTQQRYTSSYDCSSQYSARLTHTPMLYCKHHSRSLLKENRFARRRVMHPNSADDE